jgi:hypothetical protein
VRIELHPEAAAEAKEAAHWYDDQQLELGAAFLDRLDEAYRKIKHSPRRFAKGSRLKSAAPVAEVSLLRDLRID